MEKGKIAVAIPVYTTKWSPNEKRSFRKCMSVLSDYDIYLVTHDNIDLSEILSAYPTLKTVFFDKDYFTSVKSYNRLVLSENFYAAFEKYEYMLIYQLDAFVFRDELKEWCEQVGITYATSVWDLTTKPKNRSSHLFPEILEADTIHSALRGKGC